MRAIGQAVLAAAVAAVLALWAGPAAADEPGESDEARVLVLQAIALIVNTPDDMHVIEERVEDALQAPHKEGVDMASVERAAEALEEGDLQRTRELLQTAIGAGPFVGSGAPKSIGETSGEPGQPAFAAGAEAGTTVVLDEYTPDRGLDDGEIIMLVLSIALIVVGAWMAWRFRPPETVHQLRQATATSTSREA